MTQSSNDAVPISDLRVHCPRRWNAAIDGIVWLPRLIDKARAFDAGTLGIYLYGQSPVDTNFLRAAGVDYATFLAITRAAPDDFGVLAELDRRSPGAAARLRAWTANPPPLAKAMFRLVDADEGYATGPDKILSKIPPAVFGTVVAILRRLSPFHADAR